VSAWPATVLALAPFAVFPLHDIEARCLTVGGEVSRRRFP
jgi:hypothetical protein